MTSLIVLIVVNTVFAWMFACILKKYGQNYFLSVFLIAAAIPLFGIVIMSAAIIGGKGKSYSGNQFTDVEVDYDVFDDSKIDFTSIMPIHDALTLKNAKQKRKVLFSSLKGNWLGLYPFLLKALKDRDTEIVHYASSIITDYRREIYENFEKTNQRFALNSKDHIMCKEYIDAFHALICWEEVNEMKTNFRRKSFEKVLEEYFSLNKDIEEKHYIQKIKNEIELKEFNTANETCMRFLGAYSKSSNPYLALLELNYCRKQDSEFRETLISMKNKDVLLSCEAADIISFWEGKVNINRGIK